MVSPVMSSIVVREPDLGVSSMKISCASFVVDNSTLGYEFHHMTSGGRSVYVKSGTNESIIIGISSRIIDICHRSGRLMTPFYSGGPSRISFYVSNGNKESEVYRSNGLMHRESKAGPAKIIWEEDGSLKEQEYWYNNLLHRPIEEGPAIMRYYNVISRKNGVNTKIPRVYTEYREFGLYISKHVITSRLKQLSDKDESAVLKE
jgi:hypothetical protein